MEVTQTAGEQSGYKLSALLLLGCVTDALSRAFCGCIGEQGIVSKLLQMHVDVG